MSPKLQCHISETTIREDVYILKAGNPTGNWTFDIGLTHQGTLGYGGQRAYSGLNTAPAAFLIFDLQLCSFLSTSDSLFCINYAPEVRRGKYWRFGVFSCCNTSLLSVYEKYCIITPNSLLSSLPVGSKLTYLIVYKINGGN